MNAPFRFDFGVSPASGEESKPMGADQSAISSVAASAEASEATAHIEQVRKRGRPRRNDPEREAREAAIRESMLAELHSLFSPEQWEGIVRGPADLMLHVSKRDLWRIEDREIRPLAVGAANSARLFLQADPKWIALFMFSVSLAQVYGARIALHVAQNRKEEKEKAANAGRDKPV